ncbi:MAG: response regulator [Candidatus Saganbacteria bacterium]|nr:response regulator [Candidatus Saganbacteria bacterium]
MGSKKVLVIEDEKELAEMIKMRLLKERYEVELAYDGEEGLAKAKSLMPDLIILDIKMPKLDGYTVCEMLKSDKKYKHIPIIMLTVRVSKMEMKRGFEAGTDEYLTKPYDGEALISKVKEYLK